MFPRTSFISLLFIIGCASAAVLSSELAHYGGREDVKVSSDSIAKIKQVIEDEITSHITKTRLGLAPQYAALSCKQLAEQMPHYDSGYYWIEGMSGPVGVYCDVNPERFNQTGGWMRIANVDMRNNLTQCPCGLRYDFIGNYDEESKHLCHKQSLAPGCATVTFPAQGVKYSKVCGKVIGYQFFEPNGFGPSRFTPSIEATYVDGVSITHGSPRQHVWTLAAASSEAYVYTANDRNTACPCIHSSSSFSGTIVGFVENDYYCETGNRAQRQQRYYFDNPLWDGEGCEGKNECCDRGGPWFCSDLEGETFDDIELRVCTNDANGREDVLLEQIELYVH